MILRDLLRTVPLFVVLLVASCAGNAAEVTHADRESTYPDGVANVTHSPWRPAAGEDIDVTLRLEQDARVPARVSLIFCRVEPQYVCGAPQFLDQDEAGTTWTGTIAWDDRFMKPETVHLGYNLTMRHLEPDGTVSRVAVPAGNHWLPETYPADAEGTYYFVRYGPADDASAFDVPPVGLVPMIAAIGAILWCARRRPEERRRG